MNASFLGVFLLGALKSPILVKVSVTYLLDLGLGSEVAVGITEVRELRVTVVHRWMMARIGRWEGNQSGDIELVQSCAGIRRLPRISRTRGCRHGRVELR